jgi:PKD repeat protein
MRPYFVVFCFCLLTIESQTQSVQAGFNVPLSPCIQENFTATNTSLNANHYEWDICQGDLILTPTASILTTLSDSSIPTGMDAVYDGTNWYAFVTSRANNSIFRVSLGNDLSNTGPTVNLGNPSSLLDRPTDIKIVTSAGKWYGFVYNESANAICRLDFGTALTNIPTATIIENSTSSTGNQGLDVITDGSNWYVVYTFNAKVGVLRLATIESIPVLADKLMTPNLAGNPQLGDIKIIESTGFFFAYAVSYSSTNLYKLSFGTNLFSLPVQADISSGLPMSPSYYGVDGGYDAGQFYLLLATLNGSMVRVNLGDDLSQPPQGIQNFGNLGVFSNTVKNRLLKAGSTWHNLAVDYITNNIYKASFPTPTCQATPGLQTSQDLKLSFSTAGTRYISLRSFNGGEYAEAHKSITISSLTAPSVDFSNQQVCLQSPIQFNYTSSQPIVSQSWDFGDTQTSALSNPQNTYASVGTYTVKVNITSSNGCKNLRERTIKIYSQPSPTFTLPSGLICTNNEFTFTNNTIDNFDGNLSYQWLVDNHPISTTRNLNHTFTAPGSKDVKLITSIPGCSSELTQTIGGILPGPVVGFTVAGQCQNEPIQFTNTGDVATYTWNFGNGQTSTTMNATHSYSAHGNYTVTLQSTSSNGCINTASKPITIYSKPQTDFSIGLPPFSCAGTPSQFNDLTPSPSDSNISSWAWSFGDPGNGSSVLKNPTYTYPSSGNYTVSLSVNTNFGCTNSVQKSVTISPSPIASYSNLPACINQSTQFNDASSGNIKSRLWQIGTSTFTTPNPQFTFLAPGSYPVLLTVTGNNNCTSQISKNIQVPVAPALDFAYTVPCTNAPTVFTEITSSTDPPVSQSWAYGSLASGTGNPSQYSFAAPGNYSVRLSSTRQSGCVYSTTKSVSIINSPIADFSPSSDAGASPLQVSFSNNSSFANAYLWKFGDANGTSSSLEEPFYEFTDLGDYNVELTATNLVGCVNKANKTISVVVPFIDVAMTDFYFLEDNATNSLQPVISLVNKSNVSIIDPIVLVDVAGGSFVRKRVSGIVRPNQELTQLLDFQLVSRNGQYVCAEVEVSGDTDLFSNRKCISLSGEEIHFAPFPNPARAEFNMDWISKQGDPVTLQIVSGSGRMLLDKTIATVVPGINRLVIDTSKLASGIYFIRFSDSKVSKAFSFAVVQ